MSAPHTGSTMSGMLNATLNDLPDIIDVDGRPWWLFPGGELLPVVSGGDGPNGGSGGDGAGSGGQGDDGGSGGGAGDGSGAGSGEGGSGAAGDDAKGGDTKKGDKLELTQAEIDDMIEKRLSKARKGWDAEIAQAAERAKMDESQRAKAEKEDAEKQAAAVVADTNMRLVRAEAKVMAVAEGVAADKAARFVKVLGDDLDGIDVDDDGEVDSKALKKAIQGALKDFPEFKAQPAGKGGSSGGDMNGNGGKGKASSLDDAVEAFYAR